MPDTYIVVNKITGESIFEFFNEKNKKHINTEKYTVMTAREYLPTLNNKENHHD